MNKARLGWRGVRLLLGRLSGRMAVLPGQQASWTRPLLLSLVVVILLSTPLSLILSVVIMNTHVHVASKEFGQTHVRLTWAQLLAYSYCWTVLPYLLWVPLIYSIHWCLIGRKEKLTSRQMWALATRFYFPYFLIWCVPISRGWIILYLRLWVLYPMLTWRVCEILYVALPVGSGLIGLVWLSLGIRSNRKKLLRTRCTGSPTLNGRNPSSS